MKGIIKELFGWIVFIVIVAAASYLVVAFVGQRTQVSGESMETTLSDGADRGWLCVYKRGSAG